MDCVVQDAARPGPRSLLSAGSWPILLLVGALVTSCGPTPRPDPVTWRATWVAQRAELPAEGDLEGPNAREVCERLLVASHTARQHLLPSPDEALDRAVEDWIERAGGLAYDCPGAKGDAAAVRSAMQGLDEIAAEVEAALQVMEKTRGPGPRPAPA